MPKSEETAVAKLVADELNVRFAGKKRLDGWGEVDCYSELSPSRYLILEVESGQHHPNTNVLKLWPYLDAHPDLSITLAHAFIQGSRCCNSSRGNLATWLGVKLESFFPDRFDYCRSSSHPRRIAS